MIYFSKLVYLFILIVQFNFSNTLKFHELYATDLKGNNVSFQKYENKLVILYQLSPIFNKPAEQIKILNLLYDDYHHKGKLKSENLIMNLIINLMMNCIYLNFFIYLKKV